VLWSDSRFSGQAEALLTPQSGSSLELLSFATAENVSRSRHCEKRSPILRSPMVLQSKWAEVEALLGMRLICEGTSSSTSDGLYSGLLRESRLMKGF
jgi:hypothetical protein